MGKIFSVKDRENVFGYVLSAAKECSKIIALVQVGSGATGYRDERSDALGRFRYGVFVP